MREEDTGRNKNTVKNRGEKCSKELLTDGGSDIRAATDDELADKLAGVSTAAESALSDYDLAVIGEAVSRLGEDQEAADPEMATDGGLATTDVHPSDLSLFQAAALATVTQEPRYGLGIKRRLQEWYGEEVNHGRLYPNLDELVEMGLVEKSERDKRTNEYEATPAGEQVLRDLKEWFDERLPEDQTLLADGGVTIESQFLVEATQLEDVSVSTEEDRFIATVRGPADGVIDASPVVDLATECGHSIGSVITDVETPEVTVEVER